MNLYVYKATVTKVYDGDTVTVDIDLGFSVVLRNIKLRLLGIDTPEMRGGTVESKSDAKQARDYVREKCLGKEIYVESRKKGKYGRYLATIWTIEDDKKSETSINDLLIENNLAVEYMK
jgi:micrococcal nuclease|tara:strand:+ start:104 stop:460 length:357 start_codon:yes stop_codon:yes gene_type:complete